MGRFFVTRPIFAIVVAVITTIVGMLAYFELPIEQYPEIAPPSIVARFDVKVELLIVTFPASL